MKPVHVKSSAYIDFAVENNDKDPKLEVGDHIATLKNKTIFTKGYTPKVTLLSKCSWKILWKRVAKDKLNRV